MCRNLSYRPFARKMKGEKTGDASRGTTAMMEGHAVQKK
jgi:hypothetical protein